MLSSLRLRQLGRLLLPPLIAKPLARLWPNHERPLFEYVPDGLSGLETAASSGGWDAKAVVAAERARWEAFCNNLKGAGPLGFSHESTDLTVTRSVHFHNIHITYAYVLSLAAWQKTQLSVLDWGGGLGYYYQLGKVLVPGVTLDYSCRELPMMCEYGRSLCPEVTFYADDSCLEKKFHLVVISGTLGYMDNWAGMLRQIAGAAGEYLLLTRMLVVDQSPSFLLLHRAANYQYGSDMLVRVFNRHELLGIVEAAGFHLAREFVVDSPEVKGAPEECIECGWLFKRNANELSTSDGSPGSPLKNDRIEDQELISYDRINTTRCDKSKMPRI